MKKIMMLIFLAIAGTSFSQTKEQVDQRLIENNGSEIYTIMTYRKDYYKFLLWELDNAYEIVNSNSVTNQTILPIANINDGENNQFTLASLDNLQTFNFIKYNFTREKENDVYYDLGNGNLLKFTGLKVMWKAFDDSGLNTKQ
jgi:hypothetical protein